MTYRLVGLMSLVLLLSLAAFALLMGSYQEQVMGEVTRTISEVGRATFHTFETRASLAGIQVRHLPSDGKKTVTSGFAYKILTDDSPHAVKGHTSDGVAVIRLDPRTGVDDTRKISTETSTAPGKSDIVMVRIEEIHAERGPAGDTLLRIPTLPVDENAKSPGATPHQAPLQVQVDSPGVWVSTDESQAKTPRKEIILPIPTQEFRDLFADFRARTLWLFLGVFVLGTLLSAGLAARFTRPVRRLDAGIRRLSDGDLSVQVEDGGRDEIGRLGRAFNEMARRLRAGREREREMRRREKLSSLGRMAAGVAHDVRNPLHSINLTLQNLQETARPDDPSRGREFDRSVSIIREEIRRLDRLVENFLRFARSDRADRTPVDLTRLARETTQLVEKEAARRSIQVEVRSLGEPGFVEGDVESIRSSILNLVLNSFEAMAEGGTLILAVSGEAGETRLEVADTGCGIAEENQEKVFDFAYTSREDGYGLGLAMVHQVVVEDHGGRVELHSRPGEGTRVILIFPERATPRAAAS